MRRGIIGFLVTASRHSFRAKRRRMKPNVCGRRAR